MPNPPGDTPEARAELDARFFGVMENKEDTLAILNAFAEYTDGAMTTDRLAHTDHWNIYMSPKAARDILNALQNSGNGWHEGYEAGRRDQQREHEENTAINVKRGQHQ